MSFSTTPLDLQFDLEAALDGPVDLVTTSALLDLVSDLWLERLIGDLRTQRITVADCDRLRSLIKTRIQAQQRAGRAGHAAFRTRY